MQGFYLSVDACTERFCLSTIPSSGILVLHTSIANLSIFWSASVHSYGHYCTAHVLTYSVSTNLWVELPCFCGAWFSIHLFQRVPVFQNINDDQTLIAWFGQTSQFFLEVKIGKIYKFLGFYRTVQMDLVLILQKIIMSSSKFNNCSCYQHHTDCTRFQ